MRHKDPELMKSILEYVEDFYKSELRAPTTLEIGKAHGICKATAYNYLVEMNKIGLLKYDGKTVVTAKINRRNRETIDVPRYNAAIPCEPLEELAPEPVGYVSLPSDIFGSGDMYIIPAKGESMIEAGIDEGDLVVVEKSDTASVGDIVVALGNGTENSLKRLIKKKNKYYLHPENEKMDDIFVEELKVKGVAKFVIKKL